MKNLFLALVASAAYSTAIAATTAAHKVCVKLWIATFRMMLSNLTTTYHLFRLRIARIPASLPSSSRYSAQAGRCMASVPKSTSWLRMTQLSVLKTTFNTKAQPSSLGGTLKTSRSPSTSSAVALYLAETSCSSRRSMGTHPHHLLGSESMELRDMLIRHRSAEAYPCILRPMSSIATTIGPRTLRITKL